MANEENGSINEYLKGCYGSRVLPSVAKKWLIENILDNTERDIRVTLDFWSVPGIGKTSIVKSLEHYPVDYKGKHYDGFKVIDIPIAQVEEMGDVLGFPIEEIKLVNKIGEEKWVKSISSVIDYYLKDGWMLDGTQRTTYAPPSWVPKEERPGILLFDDANRASQRIMKGIMQLVQDYRTIAWSIPKGWTIVFTGNPDNRFNQVTSMDTAQLTRIKHVTLVPDAVEWSVWAESNNIDKRLINFVLRYPEMLIGSERTNPRTLAEFGRALKRFPNLDGDNYDKCLIEANASLDSTTVDTMMVFFKRSSELVIDPQDILEDYEKNAKKPLEKLMTKKEPRIDIVNVINDRLYAYIVSDRYKFEEKHVANLQAWILDENLPKDTSYAFVKRLINSDSPHKRKMLSGNTKLIDVMKIGLGSLF